jgi:hypothetical protein
MYDLGASNEQLDPKIRIYEKWSGKVLFSDRNSDWNKSQCWSTVTSDGQRLKYESQWQQRQSTHGVSNQSISIKFDDDMASQ